MRLNNGQDVLARIEKMYKHTVPLVSPTETTLSAAADAGDDEIALTSEVGLADGSHVLIYGSEMELATILLLTADPNPTLSVPLAFAAPNGSRVVLSPRIDLGFIEEGGVSVNGTTSQNAVNAANARAPIAYVEGDGGEMDVSFGLREASIENFLAAFQVDESTMTGAGTASDPYLGIVGRDTIGSQLPYALRGTFRRVNGKATWVDFLNCYPEVQFSAALGAKGAPVALTVRVRPTSILIRNF